MSIILRELVQLDACAGCGVCAGASACDLRMVLTKDGRYVPEVPKDCTDCGLCADVCPMINLPAAERDTQNPLGDFITALAGVSSVGEEWASCSSGGLATRSLKTMLREKMIDAVICVDTVYGPSCGPEFHPRVCRTAGEVAQCAGSKYGPVEFSQALRIIKEQPGRYAVVALPCAVRGLRLAKERLPWADERIHFILGLTCGHNVSLHYVQYLLWTEGIDPAAVSWLSFRVPPNEGSAVGYGFQACDDERLSDVLPYNSSIVGQLWGSGAFALGSCGFCEDVFAEYADASFMDAWLPAYTADPRGTSLVLARHPALAALLEAEGDAKRIGCETVSDEQVLRSQEGPLHFKSYGLSARAALRPRIADLTAQSRTRPLPSFSLRDYVKNALWLLTMRDPLGLTARNRASHAMLQAGFSLRGLAGKMWMLLRSGKRT